MMDVNALIVWKTLIDIVFLIKSSLWAMTRLALLVTWISAQLLILQGVDEYQCTVSATYTVSITGCSLAAVADMSHLHSARKKNKIVWYQVMLELDRSGCYKAFIPPTAMMQPRPLLSLILRIMLYFTYLPRRSLRVDWQKFWVTCSPRERNQLCKVLS